MKFIYQQLFLLEHLLFRLQWKLLFQPLWLFPPQLFWLVDSSRLYLIFAKFLRPIFSLIALHQQSLPNLLPVVARQDPLSVLERVPHYCLLDSILIAILGIAIHPLMAYLAFIIASPGLGPLLAIQSRIQGLTEPFFYSLF